MRKLAVTGLGIAIALLVAVAWYEASRPIDIVATSRTLCPLFQDITGKNRTDAIMMADIDRCGDESGLMKELVKVQDLSKRSCPKQNVVPCGHEAMSELVTVDRAVSRNNACMSKLGWKSVHQTHICAQRFTLASPR